MPGNNQEMEDALREDFESLNAATSYSLGLTLMQSDSEEIQNDYESIKEEASTPVEAPVNLGS